MRLSLVFEAMREPEAFSVRWSEQPAPLWLYGALAGSAALGVGTYGAMLHAWRGGLDTVSFGLGAAAAAGVGWTAAMPCLVVLGGLLGSRLAPRVVVMASLVAVSFGGLCMLASVPVLWFFELVTGHWGGRVFAMLASAGGVGLCMADVFTRCMRALEGFRLFHWLWIALFGAVSLEMFVLFGLHRVIV